MINPEYDSNIILRIYHDGISNKLCLLKCRFDQALYLAFINLNDGSIENIDLHNMFYDTASLKSNHPAYERVRKIEHISKRFFAAPEDFGEITVLTTVHAFEADLKNNNILLQANYSYYKIVGGQIERDNSLDYRYMLLTLDGQLIQTEKLTSYGNINDQTDYTRFFKPGTFVYGGNDAEDFELKIWNVQNGEKLVIDLKEDVEHIDEEILLEYIADYDVSPLDGLIAITFQGPTYGVDCVGVFKFDDDYKYDLTFAKTTENCFAETALRKDGQELAVRSFSESYRGEETFDTILFYNLGKKEQCVYTIPVERSHGTRTIDISYFSTNGFAIIFNDKIVIYNQQQNEKIDELRRDSYSAYYIGQEQVFYLLEGRLQIYTIADGIQPVYAEENSGGEANKSVTQQEQPPRLTIPESEQKDNVQINYKRYIQQFFRAVQLLRPILGILKHFK